MDWEERFGQELVSRDGVVAIGPVADRRLAAEHTNAYVGRALPGVEPRPIDARHCWVTEVPWSPDGFAAWEADGLLFVAGNNLFKHAPALGRALARAALGDGLTPTLSPQSKLGADVFRSAGG